MRSQDFRRMGMLFYERWVKETSKLIADYFGNRESVEFVSPNKIRWLPTGIRSAGDWDKYFEHHLAYIELLLGTLQDSPSEDVETTMFDTKQSLKMVQDLLSQWDELSRAKSVSFETVAGLHAQSIMIIGRIVPERELKQYERLDPARFTGVIFPGEGANLAAERVQETIKGWVVQLDALGKIFTVALEDKPIRASANTAMPVAHADNQMHSPPNGKKVFIMHGHDETNRLRLEKMIRESFHLTPVVMMDKALSGLTNFLNKFTKLADECDYAIALFTKDDFIADRQLWQGRPNVIFELGWFCKKWDGDKVTLLVQEGTSMPSDLQGTEEFRFKDSVEEKYQALHKILQDAGLAN